MAAEHTVSFGTAHVAAEIFSGSKENTDAIGRTRIAVHASAVAAEYADNIDEGKIMTDEPAIGGNNPALFT